MLTADAQYAANVATLAEQPAMQPLLQQMAMTPLFNIHLQPAPTGALAGCAWDVPQQTWVPLCDLQDPIGAATQVVGQVWNPDTTVFTMLGVGLGYAITAFAQRMLPYQRLVVWDPEATFFKAMLHAVDIKDVFLGKRVEVYVGADVLSRIEPWYLTLEVHEKLHMAMPCSHSYTAIYHKDDYAAAMTRCLDMIRFHMVGLATWRQFGRHISESELANLPEYYANPGMTALKDLWKGKPAVCIAAGPSLQRNLAQLLLPTERAKVALITAGTTYGLVQGLGLQPDIVTTIDFQHLNYTDQFRRLPLDPDCTLVYLHSTACQTVRRWPGPCFVAENSSDTLSWIRQFTSEDKGQAGQVQTVAHLSLLVALMLGANPIILLGQDLSMPLGAHHAPGARAQDTAPVQEPPEAFFLMNDMHGQPVHTRHSFASMLLVFERIIAEHPETTFLNASEQGLLIKGARHCTLAEALAQLPAVADMPAPARPLFQGDTMATVHAPTYSSLRADLREVSRAYAPQVGPALVDAFAALCTQVDEIKTWATETVERWNDLEQNRIKALTEERPELEMQDEVFLPEYQAILASEKTLAERPHATGLYVIRRFDFIELKSEIPPHPDLRKEPWQEARYAASRLARAAEMFVDEAPALQRLLQGTKKRLIPDPNLTRALAKQQYRHAATLLYGLTQHGSGALPIVGHLRVLAQLYRQTNQYAAALALMESCDNFSTMGTDGTVRHAERIRGWLARYQADIRQALPAYFVPQMPLVAPLDGWQWWASLLGGGQPILLQTPLTVSQVETLPVAVNGHYSPAPLVQDADGSPTHALKEEVDASI